MQSIFGFYYIMGLLSHMGWPRRKSLLNSTAVVDSLILDSAVEQMIDWAASIGACRPKLALQIIATMLRDTDWESKEAMDLSAEVGNMKKQWAERGNSDNPREAIKPVKFSKHSKVMTMKQLKDKEISHALEVYCYESLIWGLVSGQFQNLLFCKREKANRKNARIQKSWVRSGLHSLSRSNLERGRGNFEGLRKRNTGIITVTTEIAERCNFCRNKNQLRPWDYF